MVDPERFIKYQSGQAVALKDTTGSDMQPAGASHAKGLVPDPGSSSHNPPYYLGDDAQFHTPTSGINPIYMQFVISGGGNVIQTGASVWLNVPFISGTISAWHILADQSGSITVDILGAAGAFPTVSLVGSGNGPLLSSAQINEAAVSGWTTTTITQDEWILAKVTGTPSSITQVTVAIQINLN